MYNTPEIMTWNANGLVQPLLDINKIKVYLITKTLFTKQ